MSTPKNVSRRAFLRISSFSVAGLALAACAAPGGAPSAPAEGGEAAAPSGEQVEIRYHARIGQQEDTLYDMQEPKFMEENPNIALVRESFPGAEYEAKMATMFAGGTQGDVIWSALGGAKIQFAYSQGQVAAVDDLVAAKGLDLNEWYEGCINAITLDGNLLGLPFKAHPGLAVVYYNQTAIEAAGGEIPTAEWTQEQHIELAKLLTVSEGDRVTQFGYLPNAGWKGMVTLSRAFGGELLNEDGTVFQVAEEASLAAVNYLYDLFQTHNVAPTPDQMLGAGNDMWISGVLGTYQGGTSVAVTDSSIGDAFEWMAVSNPIGPAGVGGSDYEVDAQCVTTASQSKPEAFEWVHYLCNQESGTQLGIIGGTVGGRPDVYGAEVLLQHPYRVVFKEIMDNAMASRITNNWRQTEAEVAWDQLTQPLWAGDAQPDAAFVESVRVAIQDIMDKPRP